MSTPAWGRHVEELGGGHWRCLRCGRKFSPTSDHVPGGRFCVDDEGRRTDHLGRPL